MEFVNLDKKRRAEKWAKDQNKEGDAETIKARYIALGGLIRGEEEADSTPKALEDMTVPELKAYAKANAIDISAATNKTEILETIQAAV